jgi:hypothetical protein
MRRTLVRSSAYANGLQPEVLNLLIEPILAAYTTIVATPEDDADSILGYLVHDGPRTVAFVYVKEGVRRKGIATALASHAGVTRGEVVAPLIVTKMAGVGNFPRFAESKGYTLRYRPYEPLRITHDLLCATRNQSLAQSDTSQGLTLRYSATTQEGR